MGHPLLDRHSATEAREPKPETIRQVFSEPVNTKEIEQLLAGILRSTETSVEQLCVTNRNPAQDYVPNFPVPRTCRRIIRRTGQGGDYALAANTPLEISKANEARLGGTIVNYGTGAVKLYLAELGLVQQGETQAYPTIALAANGSWNYTLGNLLWCGCVIAVSVAGSNVTVAEV